jgi:DNA-binding transcriptional LysR family regulator
MYNILCFYCKDNDMLDLIENFIAIHNLGSFSAVARKLDLSVSAISRKLDALEQELGIKLFNRSSRSLILTDKGLQFLPQARNMLDGYNETKASLHDSEQIPTGLLSITAPAKFAKRFITPAVMTFMEKYPKITVDLHVSDDWVDLNANRKDVAIRIGELSNSDLIGVKIAPMRRILCASPKYIDAYGLPKNPEDLLHHNCLTLSNTSTPADWWNLNLKEHKKPLKVSGSFKSNDTEALLDAALAGKGICHLASWLVYEHIQKKELVPITFEGESAKENNQSAIYAVRLAGKSSETKFRLFVEHIKREFGSPPFWDNLSIGD